MPVDMEKGGKDTWHSGIHGSSGVPCHDGPGTKAKQRLLFISQCKFLIFLLGTLVRGGFTCLSTELSVRSRHLPLCSCVASKRLLTSGANECHIWANVLLASVDLTPHSYTEALSMCNRPGCIAHQAVWARILPWALTCCVAFASVKWGYSQLLPKL